MANIWIQEGCEFHSLFHPHNRVIKSRTLKGTEYMYRMGEDRGAFKIITGKTTLGRLRCSWEDNVTMDNSAQDKDFWRVLCKRH